MLLIWQFGNIIHLAIGNNHKKYKMETELSKLVWSLKDKRKSYSIKWKIIAKAPAYRCGTRRCDLCRAWYGMEWNGKWNGTEISVWNMEDARMEWNGRFQEWNGRQSSILPYQFHTRFCA